MSLGAPTHVLGTPSPGGTKGQLISFCKMTQLKINSVCVISFNIKVGYIIFEYIHAKKFGISWPFI